MRKLILAAALAAIAVPTYAQPPGQDDRGHDRGHDRGDDHGRGPDRGPDGDHGRGPGPGFADNRGRGPGPGFADDRGPGPGRGDDWRRGRSYDWNRPDPRYGRYDASRYYHPGGGYRERRLGRADRIYYGSDGRYYCRRSDGTTGLIIGGVLDGVIGNSIGRGGSSTLATLLGAAGGAALGSSIDRGNVRCR